MFVCNACRMSYYRCVWREGGGEGDSGGGKVCVCGGKMGEGEGIEEMRRNGN